MTNVAGDINNRRIRAIETKYKGYRFRSRLEARWAVFFDALGISWEYEKEGYDLGKAGYYLPDFYLPGFHAWAEVKPSYESKTREEAIREGIDLGIKSVSLLRQTGGNFIYLPGMPENKPYLLMRLDEDGPQHDSIYFHIDPIELERAVIAARSARFEHGEHP